MSKILLVTFIHVVLAQNFPNARPYVNTNLNTGSQFYRDPNIRNLEERRQNIHLRTEDLNINRRSENVFPYDRPNQESIHSERTAINNNKYTVSENPERVANFGRRYHHIVVSPKKVQYRTNDEQDPVNLNSRSDTDSVNPDIRDYRRRDHRQKSSQVRTNVNNNDNNGVSGPTDGVMELTAVPVVYLTSPTLKTNKNNHSYDDNSNSNDNAEASPNSDGLIFSEIDNRNTDSFDKTTNTDNEVRGNNNGTGSQGEGERWIWSGDIYSNTTSTQKVMTGGDLDDRTSFNGDGCPTGEAKVRGICTPTHK